MFVAVAILAPTDGANARTAKKSHFAVGGVNGSIFYEKIHSFSNHMGC